MCLGDLWLLYGHRCWQYNPDLIAIFPSIETRYTLSHYLQHFLDSIPRAPTIAEPRLSSVLYCRTRGPSAYPFLIVHLKHWVLSARPVVLKLQGFDGVPSVRDSPRDTWSPWDTPEEGCTFTVARAGQSVRALVGTRRYDVCHTMRCRKGGIVDVLVLAELATERDRTRAVYPATLFSVMEAVCEGSVTSSRKYRASLPSGDIAAEEAKSAVLDAFPARRQRMMEQINLRRGRMCHSAHLPLETGSTGDILSEKSA
ncbi:hypothetical protein C8R44DRAFT_930426 [Mycena epipterygia]|nr:hypothetical protein C8R44DRAFT_930426 [Mycena epipterygia]